MSAVKVLRIGTRRSRLAIAQARIAADTVGAIIGPTELVPIITDGDRISARNPNAGWMTTDGQFTGALERALLTDEVDLVVHSYKDLPTASADGLTIGAVLPRADARDCLLSADDGGLDDLPFGARVGTSSPRRAAQLAAVRSDILAVPMRGNVETRLQKLARGELDGLILAAAGLDRLEIEVPARARLPFEVMLPAPAQAALAIPIRASDSCLRDALAAVDHAPTRIAVEAERALLRSIGGGCLAPLGALGEVTNESLRLRAAFEDRDGTIGRAEASGPVTDVGEIVASVAGHLLSSADAA